MIMEVMMFEIEYLNLILETLELVLIIMLFCGYGGY